MAEEFQDVAEWADDLTLGRGFFRLRDFPIDFMSENAVERSYTGLGMLIGQPTVQDRLPRPRGGRIERHDQRVRPERCCDFGELRRHDPASPTPSHFSRDLPELVEHVAGIANRNAVADWANAGSGARISELPWSKVADACTQILDESPLYERDWTSGSVDVQYADAIDTWMNIGTVVVRGIK